VQNGRVKAPRIPTGVFGFVWLVIALAFFAGVAVWSTSVSTSFGDSERQAPLPSPTPVHAVPMIVTIYPGASDVVSQGALCAKAAPRFNAVTVETPDGAIIAEIRC